MEIYIDSKFKGSNDEQLVEACQNACGGYQKDAEGREYFFQADENILKQVYCDDESGDDTIEWVVGSSQINKLCGNLQVEFHC